MFTLKSSAAARAFIDIARCTIGNPHLVDVIEANAPRSSRGRALVRHVTRTLGAARIIAAACNQQPRKGMRVAIDPRKQSTHAALIAMLDLYLQLLELGDTVGCCAGELDVAEIRMTIQAVLDLAEPPALRQRARDASAVVAATSSVAVVPGSRAAGSSTSSSSLIPTSV